MTRENLICLAAGFIACAAVVALETRFRAWLLRRRERQAFKSTHRGSLLHTR